MAEQYLLELARKWIVANAPEPSKCVKCGQPQPSTMCTADLRCPIDYQSHVYTFTITNDPDAEAKRLAAFGQAALSTQPQPTKKDSMLVDSVREALNEYDGCTEEDCGCPGSVLRNALSNCMEQLAALPAPPAKPQEGK